MFKVNIASGNLESRWHFAALMVLSFVFFVAIEYRSMQFNIYYTFLANRNWIAISNAFLFIFSFLLIFLINVSNTNRLILVLFWVGVSVSTLLSRIYYETAGSFINASEFRWLLSESKNFTNTLTLLLPYYLETLLLLLLFIATLRYLSSKKNHIFVIRFPIALQLCLTLSFFLFSLPGHLNQTRMLIKSIITPEKTIDRLPTFLNPQSAGTENILLIIDESIAYAPFKELVQNNALPLRSDSVYKAMSLSNCSAHSHALIRWGFSPNNSVDIRQKPTIWAYAKKAGYTNVLIDGQVKSRPQNFINDEELSEIDHFIPMDEGINTDNKIAKRLDQILKSEGKKFILVTLKGTHFAYESNLPDGYQFYKYELSKIYKDALLYSKKPFFDTFIEISDNFPLFSIYTSDHGQLIKEGAIPHCTANRQNIEYEVPLIINAQEGLDLNKETVYSHSQLFPTLLIKMGYEKSEVEKYYDVELSSNPTKIYKFHKDIW